MNIQKIVLSASFFIYLRREIEGKCRMELKGKDQTDFQRKFLVFKLEVYVKNVNGVQLFY